MKYIYTIKGNTVTAQGSYAGKPIYAKAICADSDDFDANIGQMLSKIRLDLKIQKKRVKRAKEKAEAANIKFLIALADMQDRKEYLEFAEQELSDLEKTYSDLIEGL